MTTEYPFDPGPEERAAAGRRAPGSRSAMRREPVDRLEDAVLAVARDLDRRRFAAALAGLPAIERAAPRNPAVLAMRVRALAGLGRLEDAEAALAEVRLLCGTTAVQRDPLMALFVEQAAEALRTARSRASGPAAPPREARRSRPPRAAPPETTPARAPPAPGAAEPPPDVPFLLRPEPDALPQAAPEGVLPAGLLEDYRLRRESFAIEGLRRYDTLLSFAAAHGVERYAFQERTVRRVLRDFRGRALLADEVGLGKTVEAGLCLSEYLLRGLVRRALVLVPPSIVGQWKDELSGKFGIEADVVDGETARSDPLAWEKGRVLLASTALARLEPHASRLTHARFDMVLVDEAHRLKNRDTKLWRLVERLGSRFLLLLSATPVENDLLEIYNVLSLLRPGLFPTPAQFRARFLDARGRRPKDPAGLRALLREVMIRNTRAVAEARLPPRFATTLRAAPTPEEASFYADLGAALRRSLAAGTLAPACAGEVLRAAGSRPRAATGLLERHVGPELAARARALETTGKDAVLEDLLRKSTDDRILLFATHRDTLEHLVRVAEGAGRRPVLFHGSLSAGEKAAAIAAFAADADVLVSSESGGEGFNLQFARTIVNYDLPWNPMRVEQRIGRVHRIGQTREVFVFSLVAAGTVEEEILRVLDEKIDMFELVVGEVEAILGRLGDDEREFSELVLDIYAASATPDEMRARFDALAERMQEARSEHLRVRALEEETFGRELEA